MVFLFVLFPPVLDCWPINVTLVSTLFCRGMRLVMSSLIFISWWTQSLSSNYPFSPYTVGGSTFFSKQNTSRWPYFPQHKKIARSPSYSKGSSLPLSMILGTKSLSRSNSTKKYVNCPQEWMEVTLLIFNIVTRVFPTQRKNFVV